MRQLLAAVLSLFAVFAASTDASAATYLPGNQKYTQAEIQSFFQNSSNPYLQQNAANFASISYNVESGGGNSGIYNGTCCTGLMQMNQGNLQKWCNCSSSQYAAMSGQEQINVYGKYFGAMSSEQGPKTLMEMQANGQTLGGKPVDAYTLAACAQLGGPNCMAAIKNGCSSTANGSGGDGSVNVCTMADKARGNGESTAGGGGGSGTCLTAHPVDDPVIYSEYAAWNRSVASGKPNGWHRGLDIYPGAAKGGGNAPMGKPIYAAHSGKAGHAGDGFTVSSGTFRTFYRHSYSRPDLVDFEAGKEVGKIGDKGSTGAPHLHFEVEVPGSAVSASSCTRSGGGNSSNQGAGDCVFPAGSGGKRDPNLSRSMEQVKAAGPNAWFKVNPERYLKAQVPMQGTATARTGRTQSLPNTCTAGPSTGEQPTASATPGAERPSSSAEAQTAPAAASGDATYNSGNSGQASVQTNMDDRSVSIDMARQSGLDVRSRGSMSESLNSRLDSSFAHMLLLEARGSDR